MPNAVRLATRYARRPLLIEPTAARELLRQISGGDARVLHRESFFEAAARKIGFARAPRVDGGAASEIGAGDLDGESAAPRRPQAYAPLWAEQTYGEPSDEGFCWSLFAGVATLEVDTALSDRGEYYCGEWYHGYDTIQAGLRDALADERVRGAFIRLSSPGGPATGGLPALAAFIRSARATGNAAGKPIHVYADMACSAAYWIAAQADRISAPAAGLVGSIGAVLLHEDWSGALAKGGVVITPIQFGTEKTAGADWAPLSASARDDFQAEIDQLGRDFIADVRAGRPSLSAEALIATQARVFMAKHDEPARSGLALGFVDAIETEEQAFASLVTLVSGAGAPIQTASAASGAASSSPAASIQTKEPRMSSRAPSPPARAASRAPNPPAAGANTPRARAGAQTPPPADDDAAEDEAKGVVDCPTCEGTGQIFGADGDGTLECPTCKGTGDVPAGSDAGKEEAAEGDEPADPAKEARAIRNSPEAKAHPHAALAALEHGLTYDQFKAQVAAFSAAPQRGALREAMAGARRLGPDAAQASSSRGAGLVESARRMAEAQGKRS